MKPLATHKQRTLIKTLEEMKTRPTFAEQWPEESEQAFKNGLNYQKILDHIRKDSNVNLRTIYAEDKELYDWWTRHD